MGANINVKQFQQFHVLNHYDQFGLGSVTPSCVDFLCIFCFQLGHDK